MHLQPLPVLLALLLVGQTAPAAPQAQGRSALIESAYLKSPVVGEGDEFGLAVAVSGTTVLVGTPRYGIAKPGSVAVFGYDGSNWIFKEELFSFGTGNPIGFGAAVAISGDTMVVGAPLYSVGIPGSVTRGAAYMFTRTTAGWVPQQKLLASNILFARRFGASVAVEGELVVVGAPHEHSDATGINGNQLNMNAPGAGAAYVFRTDGVTYTQEAYVKSSNADAGDQFGTSVGLSNGTLVVGAIGESSQANGVNGGQGSDSAPGSGAAYVFTHNSTTGWAQEAYLKASNSDTSDMFGMSISVSGDTVAIGAPGERSAAIGVGGSQGNDPSMSFPGAAYIFTRSLSGWSQQAYVKASNTKSLDSFGSSLSLWGDVLIVGAFRESSPSAGVGGNETGNSNPESGAAYRYSRTGTAWSQTDYIKASNAGWLDNFGTAVATGPTVAVIGAPGENARFLPDDELAINAGAAYIFEAGQQVLASLATRNGGSNPSSYVASVPAIGSVWQASVDLSTTGHTFAQVIGTVAPATLLLPKGQALLVHSTEIFRLPIGFGSMPSWSVSIPFDTSLAGRVLYTQAIHAGGVKPVALSNAQDLFIGF